MGKNFAKSRYFMAAAAVALAAISLFAAAGHTAAACCLQGDPGRCACKKA